ncbi:bifunctional 3-(3-hydroxy-phenyl)propionate/3-hydroxycinnamic acid hydroxylase MhpA [Catenuloplanes atrovinosus]|uniref:3-(3-hydroxy-phenyl)propionate hydroxylase n=1 Tax=Catenuloplanes atrovinosus TaxID=137266 RepID=A0AAE3YSU7_9ACTN|nr:bifunctional 3-(3-hydroxy-phenyl)propionate/3-hydroxycinnamic acid hydroxylase [Catenuloplanes atrovinosus]MDR7277981.1 3-(3-hydroxy-phenyl)propionate hydroxylase [Catenuloplanes atrovinosus]
MTADPVLVVGAGPTGLTAAILLAQRGVRVIVAERHREPYPLPRAVHLDDEGHRILQRAGVAEAFRAISRPALGLRIVDARLRTLAEFRRDSLVGLHGWPQANMFDQPALDALLRERLARLPHAELRAGTELTALDPDGTHATLRADTGTYRLRTAAVLGCDGANSTVRTLVGARSTDLGYSEDWLVVDAVTADDLGHWGGVHQVSDPRRAATFMQVGPDRYRWEFRLLPGETADSPDLEALLAPWTGGARVEIRRRVAYRFRARIADRWRYGRVFLLGDAAHETPPFIGQGLGAGLRDAANLAWKLELVLTGRAGEALLDTYQAERRRPALRLIQAARLLGAAMTGGQDRAAAVRRGVLAAAVRVPGFTAAGLRGIAPLIGPSTLRPWWSTPPTGRFLPQPRVRHRGRDVLLDDVLGPGFAVLTARRTPAAERLAAGLDAPVVAVGTDVEDGTGTLAGWVGSGRTLVIRPDRLILHPGHRFTSTR